MYCRVLFVMIAAMLQCSIAFLECTLPVRPAYVSLYHQAKRFALPLPQVGEYLRHLVYDKEQTEYTRWLKNVADFVGK